jgi:hypothetical protein
MSSTTDYDEGKGVMKANELARMLHGALEFHFNKSTREIYCVGYRSMN